MRVRIAVATLAVTLGGLLAPQRADATAVPRHDWIKVRDCMLATHQMYHWGTVPLPFWKADHSPSWCLRKY